MEDQKEDAMNQGPEHPDASGLPEDKDPWTEVIERARRDYRRPPEPPREAMWAAIQDRRRRRSRLRVVWGAPRVWIPAAAAAVLVLGFLAGRISAPDEDPGVIADRPGLVPAPGDEAGFTAEHTTPGDEAGLTAEPTAPETDPGTARHQAAEPPSAGGGAAGGDAAYRLAAASFLNRTETMLTRFKKSGAPGARGADADFAQWARVLLSETRLLLDSPAGQDPEMHRLLEELETLLAQLVLLSDERQEGQRARISNSMDRSGILLRVRNTTPNTVPYPGI